MKSVWLLLFLTTTAAQEQYDRKLLPYCDNIYACRRRRVAEVKLYGHGRRLSTGYDFIQPAENVQNATHTTLQLHALINDVCDAPTAMSHVTHSTILHPHKLSTGDARRVMIAPSLHNPALFDQSHICGRVGTGFGSGFFLLRAMGEAAHAGAAHVQLSNASIVSHTLQFLGQRLLSHGPITLENTHKIHRTHKHKNGTLIHSRTNEPTYAWPWMNEQNPTETLKHAGFFVYAWCSKTAGVTLAYANYGGPIHLELSSLPTLPRHEYILTAGPYQYRAFRSQKQQLPQPAPRPQPPNIGAPRLMFEMQTIALNGMPIIIPNDKGVYVTEAPTLLEGESPQEATQRIPIPSYSYGFIVLENARVSACSSYMRGSLSTKSPQYI